MYELEIKLLFRMTDCNNCYESDASSVRGASAHFCSSKTPSTHSCKGIITEHRSIYEESSCYVQVAELGVFKADGNFH